MKTHHGEKLFHAIIASIHLCMFVIAVMTYSKTEHGVCPQSTINQKKQSCNDCIFKYLHMVGFHICPQSNFSNSVKVTVVAFEISFTRMSFNVWKCKKTYTSNDLERVCQQRLVDEGVGRE